MSEVSGISNSNGGQPSHSAGWSGIIILKYSNSYSTTKTGSLLSAVDSTSVPGYKIESFTSGTGTITFS